MNKRKRREGLSVGKAATLTAWRLCSSLGRYGLACFRVSPMTHTPYTPAQSLSLNW